MPKPSRDEAGPWVIEEKSSAYRIVDTTGKVVAEIPYAHRSASGMSRNDARRMAESMLSARDVLTKVGSPPLKPGTC